MCVVKYKFTSKTGGFESNMMEAKFRTDKLQNGNCDTADNFVSPNTADFKTQTSHTVRFKNTATPQAEILFTATPHEKVPNTATPQIPNVPLLFG